jgi:hypothetical protein
VDIPGAQNLFSVAVGDFDGDGRPDIAATTPSQPKVFVYLHSSNGLFLSQSIASPLSNRGIVAADFNKDGRADIAVANRGSNEVILFAATADGTQFRPGVLFPVGTGSRAIVAADIDGDGRLDLVTGNEYVAAVSVLYNRTASAGPGAVAWELHALPDASPDARPQPGALAAGDFNRNGTIDVVVNDTVVLDGTRAMTVAVSRPQATYGPAVVADFSGGGNPDFARVARLPDPSAPSGTVDVVDVFFGDGAGFFSFAETFTFENVRNMFVADVNGDRRPDLLVFDSRINAGTGTPVLTGVVLLATREGRFQISSPVVTTSTAIPIGVADMDGDGIPELLLWDTERQVIQVWTQGNSGYQFASESPTAGQPMSNPLVADINEDGVPDVVGIGGSTNSLMVFLGQRGIFGSLPLTAPISSTATRVIIGDFNADGRLDYLANDGTFAAGMGDGTFTVVRRLNISFAEAIPVDIDGDALIDVVLNGSGYAGMELFNRGTAGPNLPPVADAGSDITVPYQAQFGTPGVSLTAVRSYDPNLDALSYVWMDAAGAVRGTSVTLAITGLTPGTYSYTLVVRDDSGAEARDSVNVTITGSTEIVAYAAGASYHGSWTQRADATAAAGIAAWDPNAGAPKLNAPLANPANYIELNVHPTPALTYKLWLRLKSEADSWANDSVFVQFDGAVDASGHPVYQIGSTSALAVNLEECVNCGDSGWGWRDDAWGAKDLISSVMLRFPNAGSGITRVRIQTREDGVMLDQVVLSPDTFKTTRPGAVKNDTVILGRTEF